MWVVVVFSGRVGYLNPKEVHGVYGPFMSAEKANDWRDRYNAAAERLDQAWRTYAESHLGINSDLPAEEQVIQRGQS